MQTTLRYGIAAALIVLSGCAANTDVSAQDQAAVTEADLAGLREVYKNTFPIVGTQGSCRRGELPDGLVEAEELHVVGSSTPGAVPVDVAVPKTYCDTFSATIGKSEVKTFLSRKEGAGDAGKMPARSYLTFKNNNKIHTLAVDGSIIQIAAATVADAMYIAIAGTPGAAGANGQGGIYVLRVDSELKVSTSTLPLKVGTSIARAPSVVLDERSDTSGVVEYFAIDAGERFSNEVPMAWSNSANALVITYGAPGGAQVSRTSRDGFQKAK